MKMLSDVTGDGSPLVLVPGGLTGWLSWIPFVERLAPSRKVVRVQLLAVQLGLDDQPLPADYSPKTESQALTEAIADLGLRGPVDIAAWSYGAMVTLDYALDHPETVRTLTLIEPPALWVLPTLDEEAQHHADLFRTFTGDISEAQLADFVHTAGIVPPDVNPKDLPQWPVWVQHRRSLRCNPAVTAHRDDRHRLQGLQCPVLLVKGTGSTRFLHQIIDTLAEQLPNAQIVEWPGGHAPHIVSMEPFLERMTAFQADFG